MKKGFYNEKKICKNRAKKPPKNYTSLKSGKNLATTAFLGGYRGRNCDKESSHVVEISSDTEDDLC